MKTEDEYARTSLSKLVEYAFAHRQGPIPPLTYEELAARIGRLNRHGDGHGHGMGGILGKMGHLFDGLDGEWGEGIPHIQSLVVNKTGKWKGLPAEGISEFWKDYPALSRNEKENKVRAEYERIIAFGSRWNDVLEKLDLAKIAETAPGAGNLRQYGKGGESKEHKALKEHVRRNPEIVGASKGWQSFTEYALASLDEVDVLFKSAAACIAVEVKSIVSDAFPADYERGLYQTIKYSAVLKAMARSGKGDIPSDITAVLVLESALPGQYRDLARILGNFSITWGV
jgi:hypothetical protein